MYENWGNGWKPCPPPNFEPVWTAKRRYVSRKGRLEATDEPLEEGIPEPTPEELQPRTKQAKRARKPAVKVSELNSSLESLAGNEPKPPEPAAPNPDPATVPPIAPPATPEPEAT